jgi:hypothetical protein
MDRSNGEEQVKSRLMNQCGPHVASTLEEMKWNAQGKGIFVGHFISPVIGV